MRRFNMKHARKVAYLLDIDKKELQAGRQLDDAGGDAVPDEQEVSCLAYAGFGIRMVAERAAFKIIKGYRCSHRNGFMLTGASCARVSSHALHVSLHCMDALVRQLLRLSTVSTISSKK